MPSVDIGQLITFAIEIDADENYTQYIYVRAKRDDTAAKIAASRGHPELAATIAQLNGLRSTQAPIKRGKRVRLPGVLKQGDSFDVLPQDMSRPLILDGYALHQVNPRPGSVGVSQFVGFNPICMQLGVHFFIRPGYNSIDVERDISLMERMAGRGPGNAGGATAGAPPVIRVSVDDNSGNMVPLIPAEYQWSKQNPSAPLWRIGTTTGGTGNGIVWDDKVARSDRAGRRIDATCTVMLIQYTPISVAVRSATQRSKKRNAKHTSN